MVLSQSLAFFPITRWSPEELPSELPSELPAPPSSSHSSPSPPLACLILTGEREFLFPPGSFLQPAGAETVRAVDGVTIVPLRIAANLKVRACSGAVLEDSAVRCLTRRNVCAGADGRGAGG